VVSVREMLGLLTGFICPNLQFVLFLISNMKIMKEKTKKILPRLLMTFGFFVLLLIPQISMAVDESEAEGGSCTDSMILPPCTCNGNCRIEDILILGVNIFQVAVSMLGVLVVGFIIVGGLVLLTSGGSTQRVERGKKIISGTFFGALIVVGSWFVVNTIYYASTGGSNKVFGTSWFELKEYPPIEIIPPVYTHDDEGNEVLVTPECSDLPAVAVSYGVPYPRQESADLLRLKTCIQNNIDMGLVDMGQIYTYDITHDTCNYTRGNPVCDTECSHSSSRRPSCHYGGTTGSNGAEAVDYNARDNSLQGETILNNQIKAAVNGPCNEYVGYDDLEVYYEDGVYKHAHTHLSTTACDAN
jgi:hypothetical protein